MSMNDEEKTAKEEKIVSDEKVITAAVKVIDHSKIILWVTIVLFVLTIVSLFRSFTLENSVDKLDAHTINLTAETNLAKDAAVDARDTLQEALDEFEQRRAQSESSSPTAIRDALLSIGRIEQHLCGGPCDEVPQP